MDRVFGSERPFTGPEVGKIASAALSEDVPTPRSATRHLDYHSEYNVLFKIAHCSWLNQIGQLPP
jgi:hypothetical protein